MLQQGNGERVCKRSEKRMQSQLREKIKVTNIVNLRIIL
jgi:hypothetical protein